MSREEEELGNLGAGEGPVLRVRCNDRGLPIGAVGAQRIAAPPAKVWTLVDDISRYPDLVPMVHRAWRKNDQVGMDLKFRIALFSAKFGFTARATWEDEKWLELSYASGEPAGLTLRIEISPLDGGAATLIRAAISYDISSLGWLVKIFLRHHPEIRFGVFPGTALVLLDAVRRAAEGAA